MNLIKYIRRPFCKHEYVNKIGLGFSLYQECKKCGKKKEDK